jgi:uncharacterized membrane protein
MEMPVSSPPRQRPVSRLAPVLWALLFASAVCYALLGVRMAVAHSTNFGFLFFNLVLAWIPLLLSLFLRQTGWQRRLFWLAGLLWVSFYPNSFYIVTDFIHMKKFGSNGIPKWYDLITFSGFAFAGVFLGSLSLYLLHLAIRERFGYRMGWAFAVMMLGLGSIGIYVGRFLRWNSWEVITRPWKLWSEVGILVDDSPKVLAFTTTFFLFSLMAYFFVVAMARLHEGDV